ncbi:MAG: hypothetical protein WEE67_02285 [Chloroflexota bacterium]
MGGATVESGGDSGAYGQAEKFPVGRGVVEAQPLTSASGDHAILLSQTDMPRVLILAEPGAVESTGRERVVVMPFDEDVETRVDGDALATWIAAPYDVPVPAGEGRIPVWASGFGFVVVILGIVLMVIGSAVVFSWLLDLVAA